MKTIIKFYDTSSLLLKADSLFEDNEYFAISSITLEELEQIKTAHNKDADIKYAARHLLNQLDEHFNEYHVEIYKDSYSKLIVKNGFSITNDTKILACAIALQNAKTGINFVTNDLNLLHIALLYFDQVSSIEEDKDDYKGFKDIQMTMEEMNDIYAHNLNPFGLLPNEYLIIRDQDNNIVDRLCWTGEVYRHLDYGSFTSQWFGDVKPMKGDTHQMFFADSLANNKITLVKGSAGTGKTFLSLAFLLHQLQKGKIEKIIVFCNTVATKDSAKLGYYPGTREDKLLDSQIGNLLAAKLGDRCEVERLMRNNQLLLLPMSDIRGFDTSGMKAGVYISEAQNMTVSLMKLALQRIGEDSICIIDGDCKTQVDDIQFAGANNGMKRLSKVFRGEDIYGEIELQKIHRSKIGNIAEKM